MGPVADSGAVLAAYSRARKWPSLSCPQLIVVSSIILTPPPALPRSAGENFTSSLPCCDGLCLHLHSLCQRNVHLQLWRRLTSAAPRCAGLSRLAASPCAALPESSAPCCIALPRLGCPLAAPPCLAAAAPSSAAPRRPGRSACRNEVRLAAPCRNGVRLAAPVKPAIISRPPASEKSSPGPRGYW